MGGISHGGGRFNSPNANATRIGFDLESSTILALERLGSPANSPIVEWQAVEFLSGVLVQRAAISLTTTQTSVNVTLSRAIDPNKSFVLLSVAPNGTQSDRDEQWTVRARLTSSTNVELSRNESGIAVDAYLQVVEMQGATVQRGLTTISSGSSATAAISSVDTGKSFLLLNYKGATGVNGDEARYTVRGTITSNTLLTFNRVSTSTNSSHAVDIAWEVVSMSDGTTVQRGSKATTATNNTLLDQTITIVDISKAFAYISVQGGSGANGQLDETSWTAALTSTTNLRFQREGINSHGTINWQVIQFAPPPAKLAITSVNGGTNPTAGTGFPVVVQSQSASGTPLNVNAPTLVSLSLKNGSGVLGGKITGTIPVGSNQVTIGNTGPGGVTYTKAESGVVLTASPVTGDTAMAAAESAALTFNPGGAARLAFSTQPLISVAGNSIPGPPTITVQDSLGNPVTSTASITIALGSNPGGGTLSGTTTQAAVSGVATFSNLSINKGGTGYTLTASSSGLTTATSFPFNVASGTANKLVFSIQPGNVVAGQVIGGPPTVDVQDSLGNKISSPSVPITLAIAANPGSGTLSGTTVRNTISGSASFSDLNINKIGNGYTFSASAPGLTGATSAALNVTTGTASKLAFTVQPGNAAAASSIPGPPTVAVQDSSGNTVTTSTASITLAIANNPGGGVLSGTSTKNATSGVAGFSGLSIDRTGTGYTLNATSSGLTSATSASFNITAPSGKDLVIEGVTLAPSTVQPGANVGVNYSVANRGTTTVTETYTEKIYLSTDTTLDGGDTLLITSAGHTQDLVSNGVFAGSENVTIPGGTGVGSYFILVQADALGAVTEVIETNNVTAKPLSVTGPPPSITGLSTSSGPAGTPVTISGSNFGATQGGSTVTFNGVNAAPTNWSATSITAPVPSAATTGPVVATVGGQASNSNFSFTVTAMPDLVVSSLSTPPTSVTAGSSFNVTDTTINNGNATAAASTTRYRLSLDTTITAGDPLLAGTRSVPSLLVLESSSGTVSVTVPNDLAPGQYYLAACADDTLALAESNETNNCKLSTVTAQLDAVRDRGLAWLITHQEADGNWKSVPGTEFTATATSLEAFGNAGLKNFSYSQGVSWLGNASAPSVDSLARQILALRQAQVSVGSYLLELLEWRNPALGWGAYADFETGFPDTPLALSAIRAGGLPYADASLQSALCEILTAQKSGDPTINGSWSYIFPATTAPTSAIGSSVNPTAHNISEINAIKNAKGWSSVTCNSTPYTLQTAIDNGINWLLTQKRKADGGFADGTSSTPLETAMVYPVLRDLLPTDPATEAALTYLVNSQASDGSWNFDAVQTAFVLKALPPPTQAYNDTDGDGLPDTIEIILGTNPNVPDSRDLGEGQSMASLGGSTLTVLSNESNTAQEDTKAAQADGDLNADGLVDAADVALAERMALGLVAPNQFELDHGDVSPSGKPDGVIDLNDVARIQRKVLGLENF